MTTSSSHKKLIFAIAISFFLLNNFTALYGFIMTPKGKSFTGSGWMNSQDLHQYYSIMEQARRGEKRIIYPFTLEGHQKRISIRPLYQSLGYLERIFNVSHALIFRISCAFFGIILIYCCWWFLGIFLHGEARIIGFIILLFSSGTLINNVESFTFTAASESPHFAFALISIILIIGFSYKFFFLNNSITTMIGNGLILLMLGFIHPFDVLPIGVVTIFFAIIAISYGKISITRASVGLTLMSIIGLPGSAYVLWTTINDPILNEFSKINIVKSPNFLLFALSYGPLLILATYGIARSLSINGIDKICLSGWIIIIVILIYLPSKIQERFVLGLHLPVSILSSIGITSLITNLGYNPLKGKGLMLFLPFLIILFAGNLIFMTRTILEYRSGKFPYYISKDFLVSD